MTPTLHRFGFLVAIGAVAVAAAQTYLLLETEGMVHWLDDPVITLRVSRVMAEHGVPYFNPSEAVAANTSLFWPVLLAPLHWVFPAPETALYAAFLGSGALWIALSSWVAAEHESLGARVATLAFLALGPWALLYGGSAWEHIPQSVAVTLGLVLYLRGPEDRATAVRAFWPIALSFLFRPDSAGLIGGFWLLALARLSAEERRGFVLATLPALAIPFAYLAVMWAAYGDIVPNTYHLKVDDPQLGLARGIEHLFNPRGSGPVPLMLMLLLLCWRGLGARGQAVLGLAILHTGYVAAVGGDIFPFGRFFLVLLPVLALLLIGQIARRATALPALVLAAIAIAWPHLHSQFRTAKVAFAADLESQMQISRMLAEIVPPEAGSIGLHTLGVGYHLPEHHIVDFLGKADPVIARQPVKGGPIGHNKWDYRHSLGAYDVVAAPVLAAGHAKFLAGEAETRPNASDWTLMAEAFTAADRYAYIPPERFCFSSVYGLYLDRALLPALAALETPGPDGTPCLR